MDYLSSLLLNFCLSAGINLKLIKYTVRKGRGLTKIFLRELEIIPGCTFNSCTL